MEKTTILTKECFRLVPDRDEAFLWLDCSSSIPCRSAFESQWDTAIRILERTSDPNAVIIRGEEKGLSVFVSVGPEAEKAVDSLFSQGEYILASLVNTLCDQRLFQIDHLTASYLTDSLKKEHLYLAERKDPAQEELPQEAVKQLAVIKGILPWAGITESGILMPTKSMFYRIGLSRQACSTDTLHDCSACPQTDCLYRDKAYRITSR